MRKVFTSSSNTPGYPAFAERSGQVAEATPLDPATYDEQCVGQMFRIRFSDGIETDAFDDELSD